MQVTMDMCSGDVQEEYGTEVMCAGWNPEIRAMGEAVACLATPFVAPVRQAEAKWRMPADMSIMDIEGFLRKMYAAQG